MAKITKDTLIADCLSINPKSAEILQAVGMHCIGCANDLEKLLAKLNEGVAD